MGSSIRSSSRLIATIRSASDSPASVDAATFGETLAIRSSIFRYSSGFGSGSDQPRTNCLTCSRKAPSAGDADSPAPEACAASL